MIIKQDFELHNGLKINDVEIIAANGNANLASVIVNSISYANGVSIVSQDSNFIASYNKANTALTIAQAAYNQANTGGGTSITHGIPQTTQTVLNTTVSVNANQSATAVSGLSATITPSSTSSKILVQIAIMWGSSGTTFGGILYRNGSVVSGAVGASSGSRQSISFPMANQQYDLNQPFYTTFTYLDSPGSTSTQTYQLYVISDNNQTLYINQSNNDSNNATGKRGISTITLQEII